MNPRIPQIIADLTQLESKLRHSKTAEETAKQLATIKAYAAELYLETDMEIIAHNSATISTPQPINEISEEAHPLFKPSYEDDVLTSDAPTLVNLPITESAISSVDLSGEASSNRVLPEETEPLGAPESVEEEERQFEDDEDDFEIVEGDDDDDENENDNDNDNEDDDEVEDEDDDEDEEEYDDLAENLQPPVIHRNLADKEQNETEIHEKDLHNSQNISPESVAPTPPTSTEPPKLDLFSMQKEVPGYKEEEPEVPSHEEDEPEVPVEMPHLEQRANEILSMFSFSRRFEFGNFLFGGDMKLFTVFITEMLAAGNSEEREDVFDTWYNQRQWSRRDESANDLKRNLRKMM
jgi:hypothetical protein